MLETGRSSGCKILVFDPNVRIVVPPTTMQQKCLPNMTDAQRTYQIKKLVERNMLQPLAEGARQYSIGFSNNYLIRSVIQTLKEEGFISSALNNAEG